MEFRTRVEIPPARFHIEPAESILLVGSCFAAEMGSRFRYNGFPATVNPYGTMYNPASIVHTIQRLIADETPITAQDEKYSLPIEAESALATLRKKPGVVFLTLGTNHVYRLKSTGEIVDNCEKRPAALFQEEELTIEQCADYLSQSCQLLLEWNPDLHIVFTVSPIRYRKYGYHESQLSKASLLLAIANHTSRLSPLTSHLSYFPAYEIFMDELRDYRFYAADMLHPSPQAVDYVWERLTEWCFSPSAIDYMHEWQPISKALHHRPFDPNTESSIRFKMETAKKLETFRKKYEMPPVFKPLSD